MVNRSWLIILIYQLKTISFIIIRVKNSQSLHLTTQLHCTNAKNMFKNGEIIFKILLEDAKTHQNQLRILQLASSLAISKDNVGALKRTTLAHNSASISEMEYLCLRNDLKSCATCTHIAVSQRLFTNLMLYPSFS